MNHTEVSFVGSVPGSWQGENLDTFGHLALRQRLLNAGIADVQAKSDVVIAQYSSTGRIPGKIPCNTWLFKQLHKSLTAGVEDVIRPELALVYPTVEDVRCCNIGYSAGRFIPNGHSMHEKQKWLDDYTHRWVCTWCNRNNMMPHMKSYACFTATGRVRWMLLTSTNLSRAAWGEEQKLSDPKPQLFIRNYEAGVLFAGNELERMTSQDQSLTSDGVTFLPIPYDFPPTKYGSDDSVGIFLRKRKGSFAFYFYSAILVNLN